MQNSFGGFYRTAELPMPAGTALATCQSAATLYGAMVEAQELIPGYQAMAATCVIRGKA